MKPPGSTWLTRHMEESRRKGQLSTTVGPELVSNTQAKTKTCMANRGSTAKGLQIVG